MERIVKAKLNSYRQSPRKVRLVADAIRGKSVGAAVTTLTFLTKRASHPLRKLLDSAVANAKNLSLEVDHLVVKELRVDGGAILYRRLPMSRGRAFSMRKRTSHVSLVLAEQAQGKKSKVKNEKKEVAISKDKK